MLLIHHLNYLCQGIALMLMDSFKVLALLVGIGQVQLVVQDQISLALIVHRLQFFLETEQMLMLLGV
jgi:hypothetical protein